MANFKFTQDGEISGTRKTSDGYLVANVLCARTGIQDYAGFEVGRPEMPRVRVYRPESSVFSTDSLRSYAGKPATNDHPDLPVTSDNWKELAVGSIGTEIVREGEFVKVPLILMDQSCIDDVENGKREISMGYDMVLNFESGTTSEGEAYDAVMSDLKMNHLAIVQRGRAGPKARIGDDWGTSPLINNDDGETMTLKTKTVLVDGLSVETTDAGAQAIDKLQAEKQVLIDTANSEKKALTDAAEDAKVAHDSAIAEKDKELAAKDAEIDDLKKKVMDEKALDERVKARADLIGQASSLAKDVDFSGLSDADIKKKVVAEVRGEDAVTGKSDAYIEAAFDLAVESAGDGVTNDSFREAMKDKKPNNDGDSDSQSAYEKRLNDAWKGS